jgi:hypothetical protein
MEHPTRHGLAVHTAELGMNPDFPVNERILSNHHLQHSKCSYVGSIILESIRSLDERQEVLPLAIHNYYHSLYEPPVRPTLVQAMNRLQEARDKDELLKFGSARHPKFEYLTDGLWRQILSEYERDK